MAPIDNQAANDLLESADREVDDLLPRLRANQVRLGTRLLQLRRADSFFAFGVTTFALYCEKKGLSAQEGRELAAMAEAAEIRPEVSAMVAAATLSVQKAAAVAEVLRQPVLQKPGEDWLLKATELSTRGFRDLVQERKEEVRIAEPPVELRLFISRRGRDGFRRCRQLVSRKTGREVTDGCTFEVLVHAYLERHDPERRRARVGPEGRSKGKAEGQGASRSRARSAGAGCIGATEESNPGRPGAEPSRHIPSVEQRKVLAAHGDVCWVENCDHAIWLEFAHGEPFARGGRNDAANLERLCRKHHMQRDGQSWRPHRRRDGVVVLVDRRGAVVGRYRTEAPAGLAGAERPPP